MHGPDDCPLCWFPNHGEDLGDDEFDDWPPGSDDPDNWKPVETP